MTQLAVLFASERGRTRAVASQLCQLLGDAGVSTSLADSADEAASLEALQGASGAVLVAPVCNGQHLQAAREFVRSHHATLEALQATLLSYRPEAPDDARAARHMEAGQVNDFLMETGWTPSGVHYAVGNVNETTVAPLLRSLCAEESADDVRAARKRDTQQWAAIDRFAPSGPGWSAR